jgi:putative membrane protein
MGTIRFTSICRYVPAATLAAALAAAPAVTAQTPAQDSAAHRTWNVPGGGKVPTPTTTTTTTNPSTVPTTVSTAGVPDTALVREARTDNLLETRLGGLALKRASNSAVKQFAQQMVTDHTRMGNAWASLAARTGIRITPGLDATQQQLVTRLTSLSGSDFDREYMSATVQNHQILVSTFQRLGPSAQSPEVRQLAANDLPTLEQQLTTAQQVANQVGAAVATTSNGLPAPNQPGRVANNNRTDRNGVRADQEYVQEVWQGHEMEVELAQLAKERAKDSKVKQFAENMLDDFKDYRDRWADLASKNGMTVPSHIGHLHQDKVDRLKKAARGQFDRVYLDIVRENLASVVPYFQKEGRQAQSSQVRNLVNNELPKIQDHLNRAENLGRQAQAGGKVNKKDKSVSSNQ